MHFSYKDRIFATQLRNKVTNNKPKDIMLTTDLKAKEELYEVVEPRYFENAQSLSSEDEQGSIYDFLNTISTEKYAWWLSEHENDYYFEVVRVGDTYYAIANEYYTTPAWAVEIEPINN